MIGIFGGSFDPPHCGHQALVRAGLALLHLEQVWVVPALPVHRQLSGCADADTRLRWLQAMFAGDARIRAVDWEIRRARPTASVETLREFRLHMPDSIPWLMLGADAWAGLESWREYPEHLGLCNIAVFARQGVVTASLPDWRPVGIERAGDCESAGHVVFVETDLPEVSASGIRDACSLGLPLNGMIPGSIEAEVRQQYCTRVNGGG
ncbi:MAG TPA: nicotinate (nicotinamide) nucleotide adenylyltransferase [Mariprofundaceae bacterium]|nr:nicotinate (nicotinamide) nucleotide adenylyltransferase [Mariprofundaceae bacterium]